MPTLLAFPQLVKRQKSLPFGVGFPHISTGSIDHLKSTTLEVNHLLIQPLQSVLPTLLLMPHRKPLFSQMQSMQAFVLHLMELTSGHHLSAVNVLELHHIDLGLPSLKYQDDSLLQP